MTQPTNETETIQTLREEMETLNTTYIALCIQQAMLDAQEQQMRRDRESLQVGSEERYRSIDAAQELADSNVRAERNECDVARIRATEAYAAATFA